MRKSKLAKVLYCVGGWGGWGHFERDNSVSNSFVTLYLNIRHYVRAETECNANRNTICSPPRTAVPKLGTKQDGLFCCSPLHKLPTAVSLLLCDALTFGQQVQTFRKVLFL